MSSVQINGLWVEDSGGAGEAVLCIHGLGGTSNFWSPVLPAFGERRVIRPDLAGAGRSEAAPEGLSIAHHVDALPPGWFEKRILLGRLGLPEEIGRTVRFLLFDAPYITGQIIPVDGGRSAHL